MIIVLGDLHFGMRRNNRVFQEILLRELQGVLKRVTKKDSVVILGDIFDSRSSVDFRVLNDAWNFFIELSRSCKEVFITVGNHDLYYRENAEEFVNCRFLRFEPGADSKIAPVHIVNEITEAKIGDKKCLFIPWVDSNEMKNQAVDAMLGDYDIVFGHFETIGLYGQHAIDERTMFENEDFPDNTVILSGHYHNRSQKGKIQYVGSLINSTFNDVGETKGIHTIKRDNKVEFIEGNSPIFEYINIDNPTGFLTAIETATTEQIEGIQKRVSGNIIKLIMNEYGTHTDKVFKFFKGMTPLELTVSYNRVSFDNGDDGEEFEGFDARSDIQDIIHKYIEKVEGKLPADINPADIKMLIAKKHQEFKIDQAS